MTVDVRRSVSLETAAEWLDTTAETIARMVARGELAGHYLRRQRRVYVDSIVAYQDGHAIAPKAPPAPVAVKRRHAAETAAAAALKQFGIRP